MNVPPVISISAGVKGAIDTPGLPLPVANQEVLEVGVIVNPPSLLPMYGPVGTFSKPIV